MELEIIRGHFQYEKFRKDDFAICNFKLYEKTEKVITVTGNIPVFEKSYLYDLKGNFFEHPKYGIQFQVSSVSIVIPEEKDLIIKYLSSSKFKGVGKQTATKIVEVLGEECIDKIKKDNSLLNTLSFLKPELAETIIKNIENNDDFARNLEHFSLLGLTYNQIKKINYQYKEEAVNILSENPYRLVYDVPGIGFKVSDALALKSANSIPDKFRNEAMLVSYVLEKCMNTGSTYLNYDFLKDSIYKLLSDNDFEDALDQAISNNYLVRVNDDIYHHTQHSAERNISRFFVSFPMSELYKVNSDKVLEEIETEEINNNITYNDIQKEAISNFFSKDFSIITGGPGTGKTTVVKAMIEIFKKIYPNEKITCVAPTGRASKRLKELCGVDASTIHSLLAYNMEDNKFNKNYDNPIEYDVLIIDEGSMIDSYLFGSLLLASRYVKKICILGDKDQLPSVAPGQVLADLIDSNIFVTTVLKNVYRQKDGSDIIDLASKVNNGIDSFDNTYKEIKLVNKVVYNVGNYVSDVIEVAISKGYKFEDIQVLSPIYRGETGIDNLNASLQKRFNPFSEDKKQIRVNTSIYRENDRVLQLKNQPDNNVYNGDVGIIVEIIDDKAFEVIVDFDGNIVSYNRETIDRITHAYCMSIHKAQGSEYKVVILLLNENANHFITRKLIYTAITRAKKSLVIVGEVAQFIKNCNNIDTKRDTRLIDTLVSKRIKSK